MKILLIDGMNFVHRSRGGFFKGDYALVFSFFRGLKPLVEKFSPDKVYFVLEGKPKHRKSLHPEYKANRPKASDDFWPQVKKIRELMHKLPIIQIRHPDFECDDVIANLAKHHTSVGNEVTIVSNDTDFIQVFDTMNHDFIKVYNPHRKKFVEPPTHNYLHWKALRGDASDNIPGLKGVGDKTATKIISSPEMFDEVMACPVKKEIFDTNISLIKFHWFDKCDKDLVEQGAQVTYPTMQLSSLKQEFASMDFKSMVNEKYWAKFVQAFSNISTSTVA